MELMASTLEIVNTMVDKNGTFRVILKEHGRDAGQVVITFQDPDKLLQLSQELNHAATEMTDALNEKQDEQSERVSFQPPTLEDAADCMRCVSKQVRQENRDNVQESIKNLLDDILDIRDDEEQDMSKHEQRLLLGAYYQLGRLFTSLSVGDS
jgi:hypothetical protein